jgi:hypothetical protein
MVLSERMADTAGNRNGAHDPERQSERLAAIRSDMVSSQRLSFFPSRKIALSLSKVRAFARFADEQDDAKTLTSELLFRWVQGSVAPGPVTAARRGEVLRPFLRYCRQFDPRCPVLPLGLCGPGHRRLSPHIYTDHGHGKNGSMRNRPRCR